MAKAADINGLDCAADARAGFALVLQTRLTELCGLRAAALDWSTPDGIHDMRVASRRLRSAVRDFAPYLKGRLPRKRLRRLAAALGDVRDEDVALHALEQIATEASAAEPEIAAGMAAIINGLHERRERARALLAPVLTESALAALQAKFLGKLARAAEVRAGRGRVAGGDLAAARSFARAGREIISGRLAELEATGRALYQPHDSRGLHRLRIAAKRLRYALELFAQCGSDELARAAKEVARLQKSLGELHDCDVWIGYLGARLERLPAASDELPQAVAAVRCAERRAAYWLLTRFARERAAHYQDALARWQDWETAGFFGQLQATLLATGTPPAPPSAP